MNEEAQKVFDKLTKLDVSELTPENKAFLRARRSYMNSEQKRIYEEVIAEVKEESKKK